MLHHFDERIALLAVYSDIVNGFPVERYEESEVWADRKSVNRSEFYAATQAGMKADVVFTVNAIDYQEQSMVRVGEVLYDVVRTYQKELDHVELTCTKRGAKT